MNFRATNRSADCRLDHNLTELCTTLQSATTMKLSCLEFQSNCFFGGKPDVFVKVERQCVKLRQCVCYVETLLNYMNNAFTWSTLINCLISVCNCLKS